MKIAFLWDVQHARNFDGGMQVEIIKEEKSKQESTRRLTDD